ncbi:MAG TPA: glycosyltransferase family 39 protein, partial [Candidatus Obscuribacterales bacterium]
WLNLDGKVFWHDEVYTALRVVGYQGLAIERQLFTGEPFTAATLLQYQSFAPGSTLGDTWRSLTANPEHPPLFYLLAWGWVQLWGTSITAFRSLAVIFSLLTLPVAALFGRELFGHGHPAVRVAVLLFACSPVMVLYAQEAREYSLWLLLTLVASGALLRAQRRHTRSAWGLYAIALSLLFYTSLLSALVAIAHGLYVLAVAPRRHGLAFIASGSVAVALFAPWLITLLTQTERFYKVTAWTFDDFPRDLLVKLWGLHFAALFVDPNLPLTHPYTYLVPPLLIVLIGVSLYGCWRQWPPTTALLVLALVTVPTLALIGGDLLRGSRLSSETRYFFPALGAALLAVAGWSGTLLTTRAYRRVTALGLTVLLTWELINCGVMVQAPTWWNKKSGIFNHEIAAAIAATPRPLVLTQLAGTVLGDLISISYRVPPSTPFSATVAPALPVPPPELEDHNILLFWPSPELLQAYPEAEPFPGNAYGLWRVPSGGGTA